MFNICGICGMSFKNYVCDEDGEYVDEVDNEKRECLYGYSKHPNTCASCNKLSYYEQCTIYLMRTLINKKPHGYWKEVEQIQGSLETIAEQLTKIASGDK